MHKGPIGKEEQGLRHTGFPAGVGELHLEHGLDGGVGLQLHGGCVRVPASGAWTMNFGAE